MTYDEDAYFRGALAFGMADQGTGFAQHAFPSTAVQLGYLDEMCF